MGRRAKPNKVKAEAKRPRALETPKDEGAKVRDLEKRLAEALKREAEALEQQTATSEILRVISSSPGDIQPVFDAIAANAARLCDAVNGLVIRFDGQLLHLAAHHNVDPGRLAAVRQAYPRPPSRGALSGRAILTRTVVHVPDVSKDPEYALPAATTIGYRSVLAVPMMHEGVARGTILVARDVVAPFSDTHIALIQTFADQAVIAIENVRLFTELEARNSALTEALDQQTATGEILRVISRSPTDLQPVFNIIAESAVRFCAAEVANVTRFDGEWVHSAAIYGPSPSGVEAVRRSYPIRPSGASAAARAIRDRAIVHIPDVLVDPEYGMPEAALASGFRAVLAVPMLREGRAIGSIALGRAEPGAYSDAQLQLLRTFADQAVIAIENVRLFKELETRNRDLTTALDQQTATSDILKVISSSPTDEKPVFQAIADSSVRLCAASFAVVATFDGETLHLVAHKHVSAEGDRALAATYPMRPNRGQMAGRAILERRVVHVADVTVDHEYVGASLGNRATLSVPLLRNGVPIGTITIARLEPLPFTEQQVELLKTFADQAVIAIENVRLFNETKEALDQQTATSEILSVISSSPTNIEPVFHAIVDSAVTLCGAALGYVVRVERDLVHVVAHRNYPPEAMAAAYPTPLSSANAPCRAIRDNAVIHVPDSEALDAGISPEGLRLARASGVRSYLAVPMRRQGPGLGAILVARRDPGPFSDKQIALLQTFADQAVIAIENVRLFKELEARTQELTRSVGELRALGEVGQAISSTLDLQTVLSTIVARATQLSGTDAGVIYEYDELREIFLPRATEHLEADIVETMLATPVRKGEGATGRLAEVQEPIQLPDILEAPAESRVRGALVRAGYRALLAVPLVREDHLLGGLTVIRKATGAFAPEVIDLMRTFATQSALAIQNARLFLEIEDKSRQLELASQHKSEFLANMSHELRTPMNAILGFSEVLAEGMFGEINEKQAEYLRDILESGRHLLSLINDILDLSKIEAGRMELEPADFDLPGAIDNALTLVRERAGRRGITLGREIDERVGMIRADERKVKQVFLNLLSNAIKFTPEGGRIEVRAAVNEGLVEVSVADTGVGIAPEDQEAVFEEFRQVGTADKKVEGTGLGLALSRKFIELHGGRIWVKSQIGTGSTFTFTIPVLRERSDRGGAVPTLNS